MADSANGSDQLGGTRMPAARPRARLDWSLFVFVVSVALLAFLAGAVVMQKKLPPSGQISRAMSGLIALINMEDETLLNSLTRIDREASPAADARVLAPGAGKELLLVTGGPNQDAAHCPQFGCLAWIIDRSGKVLHSWPLPLDELYGDAEGFSGNDDPRSFYPIGIALLDDGSIVATFHARNTYPYVAGIARIGWDGEVIWHHADGAHHWIDVGEDGLIYAPYQERREMRHVGDSAINLRCQGPVYDEGVRIYRSDGTVVRTLILSRILLRDGYPGLLYSVRDDCDPIHLNSVDVATAAIARQIPGAKAGDLLVSVREVSAIMLLDPVSGRIKRLISGRTAAQHSAQFLPDGTVLAFDNQGGSRTRGGSRIMRLDLVTGAAEVEFPRTGKGPMVPFFTADGGTVTPSPDGKRAMVSAKEQARDFEIDLATGQPLWTQDRVYDVAPFMDEDEPVAGYFKAYGTYYLTPEKVAKLPLR